MREENNKQYRIKRNRACCTNPRVNLVYIFLNFDFFCCHWIEIDKNDKQWTNQEFPQTGKS